MGNRSLHEQTRDGARVLSLARVNVAVPSLLRDAAFLIAILFICASCSREVSQRDDFVDSLRCGMTRSDVSRLAREHGYNTSDPSKLTRASKSQSKKKVTLLDFTFRNGALAAVREGRYDPKTGRTEYRTTDLCAPPR